MKKLLIHARDAYVLYLGDGLLWSKAFTQYLHHLKKRMIMFSDKTVGALWGERLCAHYQTLGWNITLWTFDVYEHTKTRETKALLEDRLLEASVGRDTVLIALGGGVVLDMIGFLAATYLRGVPVIYCPTSLLAMVDASLGGKTGVNTAHGKNLVGTFSSPLSVWVDLKALETLPLEEMRCGWAEMIKHAMIADAMFFEEMQDAFETNIASIMRSLEIKKTIIEQDEHEQGLRAVLNFGHTIGHAIERYENFQIRHGEAVAMGLWVESYLSMKMCGFPEASFMALTLLLKRLGFVLKTQAFSDCAAFMQLLKVDKKARSHRMRCVLLSRLGQPCQENGVYTHEIEDAILEDALKWAHTRLGDHL